MLAALSGAGFSSHTPRCCWSAEFYPFYLSQHANRTCRRLHIVGTSLALAWLLRCLLVGALSSIWLAFVVGYLFAWVGHFFFEKNRPATFKYPLYSFAGDWTMWWSVVSGARRF